MRDPEMKMRRRMKTMVTTVRKNWMHMRNLIWVKKTGEFSLHSHSYQNMGNISRTHLQELFGSFPSTDVDGDKVQDLDASDEEFHIYEQDSDDGNYSDDNDC
ncbi:General transcription factor 3C polypeptide 5-like [Quillaja saponaria]|uniref:General transcription factor 3C polypeptide 5-like n=1 Tax=Quillaja saponaria TaxID=32244 RepID=A0AAD7M5H4_QUISA|nr:General transcription factor 3C polypeptide 5-like [Quillaja saponaria]